ncbi:hypothetical protein RhiirA5_363229 [Rhizophagus irregularis]|uniref:Uncharacterized protein n=1 Tax=Rhizophagus irregularis TaxID=588596 RepID=A0A2N0P9B4_9GLOM|nr:hypothetical protein RhiirA5_363229 [Rhizophagus irregularis]
MNVPELSMTGQVGPYMLSLLGTVNLLLQDLLMLTVYYYFEHFEQDHDPILL